MKTVEEKRIYQRNYMRVYREKHPVYKRSHSTVWRKANPVRHKTYMAKYHKKNPDYRLKRYGLTAGAYNKLLKAQHNCCAICGRHKSLFTKRLHVDHDHDTGKVRGLLCTGCNWNLERCQAVNKVLKLI